MKLIVLITSQIEQGLEAAQSWQDNGAPGVTILPAHGLFSLQRAAQHGEVELPRMMVSMAAALAQVIERAEEKSQIILSLVEKEKVDALIAATEKILGDLTLPHNGILFVLDVERAIGVRDHRPASF
jgi:hypothetical protein